MVGGNEGAVRVRAGSGMPCTCGRDLLCISCSALRQNHGAHGTATDVIPDVRLVLYREGNADLSLSLPVQYSRSDLIAILNSSVISRVNGTAVMGNLDALALQWDSSTCCT